MIKNRKLFLIFIVLLLINSFIINQPTCGVIFTDNSGDIVHVTTNVFQGKSTEHPEIDIISLEITSTEIYLTLATAPVSFTFRSYEVEIYWDEVVEERGSNIKNKTKCIFDSEDFESETWVYNTDNELIANAKSTIVGVNGNVIHWSIQLSDSEPGSPDWFDANNPATVFVKTSYSEPLGFTYPNDAFDEWFDFYPDNSQSYYSEEISYLSVFGFISTLCILVVLNNFRKK